MNKKLNQIEGYCDTCLLFSSCEPQKMHDNQNTNHCDNWIPANSEQFDDMKNKEQFTQTKALKKYDKRDS